MSFVRERGNVIDYKIPIKGNLKDPEFKIKDVITDLLTNIFVKPPSSPYIFEVRNIENEVEKSLSIKWEKRTADFLPNQEKFIEKIAEFLEENKEADIVVKPVQYTTKEKEYILLYEAKKKYYLNKNNKQENDLKDDDKEEIEKMSIKDPAFLKYLDNYVKDTSLITVQAKCRVYLGEKFIQNKYNELIQNREKEFLKYFEENNTKNQVKISDKLKVPFLTMGFRIIKLTIKAIFPTSCSKHIIKLKS
ncbi:MAG: hypothetical protein HC905_15105 [Bacteroidales bacterium]|nr:hypothetical protein [Bacteroidales bacterium]